MAVEKSANVGTPAAKPTFDAKAAREKAIAEARAEYQQQAPAVQPSVKADEAKSIQVFGQKETAATQQQDAKNIQVFGDKQKNEPLTPDKMFLDPLFQSIFTKKYEAASSEEGSKQTEANTGGGAGFSAEG